MKTIELKPNTILTTHNEVIRHCANSHEPIKVTYGDWQLVIDAHKGEFMTYERFSDTLMDHLKDLLK